MINSLEIEGYRTFKRFKMSGLANVNLLVGTNNSGKTSVLEALYLLASGADLQSLWKIFATRSEQRLYENVQQRTLQQEVEVNHLFHMHETVNGATFKISSSNSQSQKIEFRIAANAQEVLRMTPGMANPSPLVIQIQINNENPFVLPLTERNTIRQDFIPSFLPNALNRQESQMNVQFVSVGSLTAQELNVAWNAIVLTPEEENVIAALKFLDPDIERIAASSAPMVIGQFPQRGGFLARMKGVNQPIPIGSLGDGVWRMLALAVSLIRSRNGILLIDEIDTGLHFSVMANMWKMITEAAKKFNIQVFATTHSYDCVRALASVKSDDISIQRIESTKDHSITYSAEELRAAAEHNIEVR